MSLYRKLRSLSSEERRFCLIAAGCLVRVKLTLVLLPYRTVLRKLQRWAEQPPVVKPGAALTPERMCALVEKCARTLPLSLSCLPRAFAGYVMCRRHGCMAELRIGVKRAASGELAAHAWLELDDRTLIGNLPDLGSYFGFGTGKRPRCTSGR
jgi:hypothetical protein